MDEIQQASGEWTKAEKHASEAIDWFMGAQASPHFSAANEAPRIAELCKLREEKREAYFKLQNWS